MVAEPVTFTIGVFNLMKLITLIRQQGKEHQLTKADLLCEAAAEEAWCQDPEWTERQRNDMRYRVRDLKQQRALLMERHYSFRHPIRSIKILPAAHNQRRLGEEALRDAMTTSFMNRIRDFTEPVTAIEMIDQVTAVYNAIEPGIGGTSESSDEGLGTADDGGYEATLIGSASTESLTESFITAQEDPAWPYDIAGANNCKTPTRATFASNERACGDISHCVWCE